MSRKLRIGAVSYLNTKPLVYRLAEFAPQAEISYDLPSKLADDLAGGRLDVALIPSVEYFQNGAYRIVSDACIGCRGPVLSVKLLCRVPPEQIRTLALDEGSRTSAALVQVLLEQRFGLRPRLMPLPITAQVDDVAADAVLLIGDRAIHSPGGSYAAVWDMGDEWVRWAELPFVFAMWVAQPGSALGEIELALSRARDAGVAHLPEIAATEAAAVGLTRPECLSYLRDNLHFYLGPRELKGLEMFRGHAAGLGLIPGESSARPFGLLPAEPGSTTASGGLAGLSVGAART